MRLIAVFICLLLFSCREKPVPPAETKTGKALAYNNRIVGWFETLQETRGELAEKIANAPAAESRRAVAELDSTFTQYIDSLQELGPFEGDTTLQSAATRLLQLYSTDTRKQLQVMPIIYTEDAIDTLKYPDSVIPMDDSVDFHAGLILQYEHAFRNRDAYTQAVDEFISAQQAFAKKFGFRVEKVVSVQAGAVH